MVARGVARVAVVVVAVVDGHGALSVQLVLRPSAAALAQSGRVVVFVDVSVVEPVAWRACSMCATRPAGPPWPCRSGGG